MPTRSAYLSCSPTARATGASRWFTAPISGPRWTNTTSPTSGSSTRTKATASAAMPTSSIFFVASSAFLRGTSGAEARRHRLTDRPGTEADVRMLRQIVIGLIALAAVLGAAGSASAQQLRLIVKFRGDGAKSALTDSARIEKLGASTGLPLRELRGMALGARVVPGAGLSGNPPAERTPAQVARSPD